MDVDIGVLDLTTLDLWPRKAREILVEKRISINKLRRRFSRILFPWDPTYEQQRQLYCSQIVEKPLMIVFPQTDNEVICLYSLMRRRYLSIRIVSGRHSPLLIQPDIFVPMNGFDKLHITGCHPSTGGGGLLVVGSRYTQGQVNAFLFTQHPGYHLPGTKPSYHHEHATDVFPGGTAGTVGAIGISLAGGIGKMPRTFGLTIDSIVRVKIVVPPTRHTTSTTGQRGRVLICDSAHHPDLFWALRGGGNQNFGFVTEITYRISVVPAVIAYNIAWEYTEENVVRVLDAWQRNSVRLPNQFNEELVFGTNTLGNEILRVLSIGGVYALQEGESVEDARREVEVRTEYLVLLGGVRKIDAPESYEKLYTRIVSGRRFHNFSLGRVVFTERKVRTASVVQAMDLASTFSAMTLIGIQLLGGVISDVPSDAMAFYPRNAKFFVDMFTYWDSVTEQAGAQAWSDITFTEFREMYGPTCYIGFPAPGLGPEDYYGANTEKLRRVKRCIDPLGLLDYPGSI